jgi:hypothetical protein
VIYIQSIIGVALFVNIFLMGRQDRVLGGFGAFLFACWLAMFLDWVRFNTPMKWRAQNARWDAFLCRIGSHRCIPICGSRCCWECIRCEPDSQSVKRHFERLAARSN